MQDHEHTEVTRRSEYKYLFTTKHHGGDLDAARWLPELTEDEEFKVFDDADFHEIQDDREWMYGVLRGDKGLRFLGTWKQQIAEFPHAAEEQPWHGYPLWPLKELGPENRRGEKMRPAKDVFKKMERAKLITARERKRLMKGDHA